MRKVLFFPFFNRRQYISRLDGLKKSVYNNPTSLARNPQYFARRNMDLFRAVCIEEHFSIAAYNLSFSSVYKYFISALLFIFIPQNQ